MENHTHFFKAPGLYPGGDPAVPGHRSRSEGQKEGRHSPPVSGGEERGSDLRKNLHPDPVCL